MRAWIYATGDIATLFNVTPNQWIAVQTSATGDNSYVYLVALLQVLLLNLNESPFFATSGIPSEQAIQQQAPPDYYVTQVQQQYAQFFTSLVIMKTSSNPLVYQVNVILKSGAVISLALPAS